LHNFGKRDSKYLHKEIFILLPQKQKEFLFFFSNSVFHLRTPTFEGSFEGSFAEVGQVITGTKFGSFLTPDVASKNDARHGIDYSELGYCNAMSGIVFLTPFLASKSWLTLPLQSHAQLRQTSLHLGLQHLKAHLPKLGD